MTDELTPARCGCGGEARIVYIDGEDSEDTFVECTKCKISVPVCPSEEEAVEDWNRAMGERTAKVRDKKDDPMVDELHHGRCMNCGKQVRRRDNYCSRCGCRLEWE